MRRGWHFSQVEITASLKDGDNLVTLELPTGWIDYRTYITGEPPAAYPALATTADERALRRLVGLVLVVARAGPPPRHADDPAGRSRQADHPHGVRRTGGTTSSNPLRITAASSTTPAAWPASGTTSAPRWRRAPACRPIANRAGPPSTSTTSRSFMGRWSTENTQGVDYFGHLGDILWHPGHQGLLRQDAAALAPDGQVPPASARGGRPDQPPRRAALRLPDEPRAITGRARPTSSRRGPGVFASGLDGTLAALYSRGSRHRERFRPRRRRPVQGDRRYQQLHPRSRRDRSDRRLGEARRHLHHLPADRPAHVHAARCLADLRADRLRRRRRSSARAAT